MTTPSVSVVVPTRGRASYLDVTLDSLGRQAPRAPWELVVVDDASRDGTRELLERRGVPFVRHERPRGANAARNTGLRASRGALVALIDDDVEAPPRWLRALLDGAARHPEAGAFGGPIRARLEGAAPRSCGREDAPITTLDLGHADREAELVWSANMMVRRSAVEQVGGFDETLSGGGEEEEWLERMRATGLKVVYLAAAGLDHRRAGNDARLRSLARGAYARGRAVRRYDRRRGSAPALARELRVLAGCGWHTLARRCPQGVVMGAHSLGRTVEAVRPR